MTRRIFCKVLLVVVAIFGLLVLSGVLSAQGRSEDAFERVRKAQEKHTDLLMAIDGVEGTAIGLDQSGQLAVKVFTARPGVAGIAKKLDDVPVHVVVTGKIYALAKGGKSGKSGKPPKPNTEPLGKPPLWCERPVPIGVSTGHPDITAGTIACRVTDGTNVYALSNNHVYANENRASIGDNVLQPGTYDGGVDPDDAIGTLADFEPIVFRRWARNEIDAAIASSTAALLGNATPSDEYGTPSSETATASVGLAVQKYGRTTGLTSGVITGINATVNVGYSRGTARFVKQIIVESGTRFIGGGDSGSLLVTDNADANPIGLLFAGTSDGLLAVANRIDLVLNRFGVTVDSEEAPPEEPPTADFVGEPTSGDAPLTVQFTDESTGDITSWSWVFGDGGSSTQQDPSHEYQDADSYTVSLTVTGPSGSDTDTLTKTGYITVTTPPAPVANFIGDPTSGYAPLTVAFLNISEGEVTSWSWDFGDLETSTEQDPYYTYESAGDYTVSLTVTGPGGSDDEIKENYITVTTPPPAPVASFTGSPTSGDAPLTVQFTDKSTGDITSWSWDFGDGGSSTQQNPSQTYGTAGVYTVGLTVTGPGGSDTITETDYITVTSPAQIEVFSDSFESSADWTANWSQDSQKDWRRRTSRKKEGSYAAEVDGRATDAQLISKDINLQGKTNATVTFWWFIESGLDKGEYLAFDVSADGGVNWAEMESLNGNVDPENKWHNLSIDVLAINNLRIRFRGTMSSSREDAYVDVVKVVAW